MIRHRIFFIALLSLLFVGCSIITPSAQTFSAGSYTLTTEITDIPDNETEHAQTECIVLRDGSNIVIKSTPDVGRSLVGSIKNGQVSLTVHHDKPDPMVEGMKLRMTFEGDIQSKNHARGTVKGFMGKSNYLRGTWVLDRKE